MEPKKYGLIRLSKADKTQPKITKNIFESDSDDDSKTSSKPVTTSSGFRRQTELDITRALTDDPNVFEYDSIYDQMKSQKQSNADKDSGLKEKAKPKYINKLLQFSENRKKENERRIERKIQKERESEGNQFEDKEQFVTNAYKQKLEEMKAENERDLKEQAIEELLDVKKQNDLSGFYRNLLNREIDNSLPSNQSNTSTTDVPEVTQKSRTSFPKSKSIRHLRERRSSSEESADESNKREEPIETKAPIERKQSIESQDLTQLQTKHRREEHSEEEDEDIRPQKSILNQSKRTGNQDIPENKVEIKEEMENKPKKLDKREVLLKIFTKRTVGQILSDAQMRYYQRKDNYVI